MIIKITSVKDTMKGQYNFKTINGVKADESEYTKDIIVGRGTADILNKLDQFGIGDFIELSYDNTKFKNVSGIKEADGFPEAKTHTYSGGGSSTTKRDDGTSRGSDTNRSAAIYLAHNILVKAYKDTELQKIPELKMMAKLTSTAEHIYNYIANGVVATYVQKAGTDKLDPPTLD